MVLTIRHRASYYKRFELDIWGVLRTSCFEPRPKKRYIRRENGARWLRLRSPFATKILKSRRNRNFLRKLKEEKKIFLPEKKLKNINRILKIQQKEKGFFFSTFFAKKLLRIFDFFYNNHLKKQAYKARARRRYIYRLDIIQRSVFKKKLKYRFVSFRLVKLFYLTFTYRQFRQLASSIRRRDGCFEHNFFLALEGRLVSFLYRTALMPNLFQSIQLIRDYGVLVNFNLETLANYKVDLTTFVTFTPMVKRLIYLSLIYRLARKACLFNPPRYIFVSYLFLYSYMKRPPKKSDLVFPISLDMYRATGYAF